MKNNISWQVLILTFVLAFTIGATTIYFYIQYNKSEIVSTITSNDARQVTGAVKDANNTINKNTTLPDENSGGKTEVASGVSVGMPAQDMNNISAIKKIVGEFINLPNNEEPTLATVTDVSKMKGQKFFAKAQNGDKVLMYTRNKEAILYRPSANKIIEVSKVSGIDGGSGGLTN